MVFKLLNISNFVIHKIIKEQYTEEEDYYNPQEYSNYPEKHNNYNVEEDEEDDFYGNKDQHIVYVKKEQAERKPIGFTRSNIFSFIINNF